MISDFTQTQLRELTIAADRPLVICDVDEVVVHFTRPFERYLATRGLELDTSVFALSGNIRSSGNGRLAPPDEIAGLIDRFFDEQTLHQEAIVGAIDSLVALSQDAEVVMLTNLPHQARDKRIANLRRHGLEFPVITNAGPKGPAIKALAARTREAVIFVDDSPNFIRSSRDHAPQVHLIHFLHDERFARHIEPLDFVSLRTGSWDEALPHARRLLGQ